MAEVGHHISKSASDELWTIASKFFHRLQSAKVQEMNTKPIPKFTSLRRQMYDNGVPKINLKIVYEDKETEEVIVVEADHTPVGKYPAKMYRKLYEVATVEVITQFGHIFLYHKKNIPCPLTILRISYVKINYPFSKKILWKK